MKPSAVAATLFLVFVSFQSTADVVDGEFGAAKKKANITIGSGSSAAVSLMVDGETCSGYVSSIGKIVGNQLKVADKDCKLTITSYETYVDIKETNCSQYHGQQCNFSGTIPRIGPSRTAAGDEYEKQAVASFQKALAKHEEYLANNYQTTIETRPPGARIVINGEYVGMSPVKGNVRPYMSLERYSSNMIKALPPQAGGCVAIEFIRDPKSPPKHMFLDTTLCPIGNDINIYNN